MQEFEKVLDVVKALNGMSPETALSAVCLFLENVAQKNMQTPDEVAKDLLDVMHAVYAEEGAPQEIWG